MSYSNFRKNLQFLKVDFEKRGDLETPLGVTEDDSIRYAINAVP